MKRKIIILTAIFILAIGSFFTFKWWFDGRTISAWALVPSNAFLVVETAQPFQDFETARNKGFWPLISHTEFGSRLQDRTTHLQKLMSSSGDFTTLFSEKKLLISCHYNNQKSCDFLFVAPLNSSSDREILANVLEKYKTNQNLRFDTREFEDFDIHEFTDKYTKITFSYIIHKNFLVGSFTGYLVEDVIRTIKSGEKSSLVHIDKEILSKEKNPSNSKGNLYINYKLLPKYTSYLFDDQLQNLLNINVHLAKTSVLSYNFAQNEIDLNGYSVINTNKEINFLNVFKWQTPQKPTVKSLISNKTAYAYFWGFENGKNLKTSLNEFWIANNQPIAWQKLNRAYQVDISNFYNWFGKQISLTGLETARNNIQDKILYIQAKDVTRAKEELNRLNISLHGSEMNVSAMPGLEIRKLNIAEFPFQLLGNQFTGFNECYYSSIQDFIIISNHPDNIKEIYNDYVSENVWSKNPLMANALEDKSGISNVSLMFHTGKSYPIISAHLNPNRKKEANDIEKQFKSFEFLSFKYSNIGDKFTSNVTAKYQTQQVVINQIDTLSSNNQTSELAKSVKDITIGGLLNQKIWAPININENNSDYFALDAQFNLHCFNKNHEKIFSSNVGAPIVSEIYALDVNHFAFATSSKVFILDIKGQAFNSFPKALPNGASIKNLNVFDYEHTRNYRLFATDVNGNLFLFDKTGSIPPTWKKMNFAGRIKKGIQHITVGGKDCLYLLEENGTFHVFNRKGEPYPGFPIKLNSRCTGAIALEKGNNFDQTLFRIITDNGEFYMFNLNGKTLQKQQLIRSSKDNIFNIVTYPQNGQWIISRSEAGRITIFDHNLQELFSVNTNNGHASNVSYYYFGSDKIYYLIHSPSEGLAFLYDATGNLMDQKAFSATGIPLLQENFEELHIYLPQMNTLSVKKF